MKCPICEVELLMSDRQGVEIDYCPQCRGIWLDRGELDKIIERSVPQTGGSYDVSAQRQQPQYRDEYKYRKHDDYKKHKKKRPTSFLEDIFDF